MLSKVVDTIYVGGMFTFECTVVIITGTDLPV